MKHQKILTKADAQAFLERYSGFHDALIVGIDFKANVQFENQGDHI